MIRTLLRDWIQSLVRKLRSHKPCGCGTVKKENKNNNKNTAVKIRERKRGRFKSENMRALGHQTQSKFVFNTVDL